MHNENTPKCCYKNKNSITGKKLLFHFYYYAGEAEIIEKNGHRKFVFWEWIIYGRHPSSITPNGISSVETAVAFVCITLRPTLSQTSDLPTFFTLLSHGTLFQLQNS